MQKKITALLLTALLAAALAGCGAQGAAGTQGAAAFYLEPAELTVEEQRIADLIGADTGAHMIFDFRLDGTVQTMYVNAYELVDGVWEPFVDGGRAFTDAQGRLALGFERLSEGLRIAVQSEHENGSTTYQRDSEDESPMSCATSFLSKQKKFAYEEELPLVVQIETGGDTIRSFDVEYFFQPEEYEKLGYEHVYAITVRFSQQPLSDEASVE